MEMLAEIESYLSINRKAYNLASNKYEDRMVYYHFRNRFLLNPLVKYLVEKFSHRIRVLDIGPGTGLDMLILQEKGFNVTGIDIAEKMIRISERTCPKAQLICEDFLTASLSPGGFEGILLKGTIHLFPKADALKVFAKTFSLLVERGAIYITTTIHNNSTEGIFTKTDYTPNIRRFRRFWTELGITSAIKQTGFHIFKKTYDSEKLLRKNWINFYAYKP